MTDALYLAIIALFFVGCRAFVRVCDRVIGDDSESDLAIFGDAPSPDAEASSAAAPSTDRPVS
jgi:hypothetical protein